MKRSSAIRARVAYRAAALIATALAFGCDLEGTPVTTVCTRVGVQCELAGGPLGVCQERPCAPGASPPCFTCTAQH